MGNSPPVHLRSIDRAPPPRARLFDACRRMDEQSNDKNTLSSTLVHWTACMYVHTYITLSHTTWSKSMELPADSPEDCVRARRFLLAETNRARINLTDVVGSWPRRPIVARQRLIPTFFGVPSSLPQRLCPAGGPLIGTCFRWAFPPYGPAWGRRSGRSLEWKL